MAHFIHFVEECQTFQLKEYFYNNSSIVVEMENPKRDEKEKFLYPLFFGIGREPSILQVLDKSRTLLQNENISEFISFYFTSIKIFLLFLNQKGNDPNIVITKDSKSYTSSNTDRLRGGGNYKTNSKSNQKRKSTSKDVYIESKKQKTSLTHNSKMCSDSKKNSLSNQKVNGIEEARHSLSKGECFKCPPEKKKCNLGKGEGKIVSSSSFLNVKKTEVKEETKKNLNSNIVELLEYKGNNSQQTSSSSVQYVGSMQHSKSTFYESLKNSSSGSGFLYGDKEKIALWKLWSRTMDVVSADLTVSHLELLHDTITACITMNKTNFANLMQCLGEMLNNFEKSWENMVA